MFILNVYSRDCVSGFPRHIGTTVGAIRRPYFPFVSFFFSTTIAYSIQLLHWKYFQEFTFLCRHFSSNIRAKRKKSNSEVRKINSLPDSQLALVVLLNWSMPVSMVNVHYSHWNLLSAANERGKEKKREKIEFYVFAYRISKCTEINCIFFSLVALIPNSISHIYYSPLMHWFSMNSPVPILKRFVVFPLFSVEWFLYHLIVSVHKTLEYLLDEKRNKIDMK